MAVLGSQTNSQSHTGAGQLKKPLILDAHHDINQDLYPIKAIQIRLIDNDWIWKSSDACICWTIDCFS
jgi:hypothetical protein